MDMNAEILKASTIEQLARTLLHSADQLNGNEPPTRQDNGESAKKMVMSALHELSERVIADESLRNDPFAKPIIDALQGMDIPDGKVAAIALKDVSLPEPIKQEPTEPSPLAFRPF